MNNRHHQLATMVKGSGIWYWLQSTTCLNDTVSTGQRDLRATDEDQPRKVPNKVSAHTHRAMPRCAPPVCVHLCVRLLWLIRCVRVLYLCTHVVPLLIPRAYAASLHTCGPTRNPTCASRPDGFERYIWTQVLVISRPSFSSPAYACGSPR